MVDLIELNLFWGRSTIWIFEHEILTEWNWGMITWYIKTGLGANWTTTTRRWLHIATAFLFFFWNLFERWRKTTINLPTWGRDRKIELLFATSHIRQKKTETRSYWIWMKSQTTKILQTNFCFKANFFFSLWAQTWKRNRTSKWNDWERTDSPFRPYFEQSFGKPTRCWQKRCNQPQTFPSTSYWRKICMNLGWFLRLPLPLRSNSELAKIHCPFVLSWK